MINPNAQFVGNAANPDEYRDIGGGYIQGQPANEYFANREGIPVEEYVARRAIAKAEKQAALAERTKVVRRDPVQEYRLQLGDEIRSFLVNEGADEARMMVGDAQMLPEMPLTRMRSIYKDMLDRGFKRI